jgi:hypothetical protein
MRGFRYAFLVGAALSVVPVLGCVESNEEMKNMKLGTGPGRDAEIKLKNGRTKPLGEEPPNPQAPPLNRK